MTVLRIRDQEPKTEEVVEFWLERDDAALHLVAAVPGGNPWYVLRITEAGLRLSTGIGAFFPLPLDGTSIKLIK